MKTNNRFENLSTNYQIILILISILIVLGAIEIGFRTVYLFMGRDLRGPYQFEYLPYVGYRRAPHSQLGDVLEYDQYGLALNRSGERRNLTEKSAEEFRVILFGGSTVEGRNLNGLSDTLTARLEKKLDELFKENAIQLTPKVINAGISSAFSATTSSSFIYQFLPAKPDFVIFFEGTNDFSVEWDSTDSSAYDLFAHNYHPILSTVFKSYGKMFSISGVLSNMMLNLTYHSAAIDFIYKTIVKGHRIISIVKSRLGWINFKETIAKYMPIHINRYERNIITSIGVAKEFQIGIANILQPTLLGNSQSLSNDERTIIKEVKSTKSIFWHDVDYLDAKKIFYEKMRNKFAYLEKRYSKQKNIGFYDFSLIFNDKSDQKTFFGDHVHYTSSGRENIISHMMQGLGNQILKHARTLPRSHTPATQ